MHSLRGVGPAQPTPLRERTIGALMLAGPAIALLTVLLPPPAEHSEAAVLACGAVALVFGVMLLISASRGRSWPMWGLGVATMLGTAMIAIATWSGGFEEAGTADNEMLFLWVSLFAFYFFSTRHALLQLAAIAVAYGLLLSGLNNPEEAPTRFVVTIGTLLVSGLLVAYLRQASEGAVADAEERARRDQLTGALNRSGLNERAAAEFNRALRDDEPIGFLLVDLDQFGTFNEVQGQSAGDDLLRHVAGSLADSTRGVDAVARLGGDEFAVLLPGAGRDNVEEIAERLISDLRESWQGPALTTVSIGGSCAPAGGHTLADLWRTSSRMLDVARELGGDIARVARDPLAHVEG